MSKEYIIISFEESDSYRSYTPVAVKVFNEQLEQVASAVVSLHQSESVEVPETGLYLVRAELPNGENVATTVRVTAGVPPTKAILIPSDRPRRDRLSWAYMNRSLYNLRQLGRKAESVKSKIEESPLVNITGIIRIHPGSGKWLMEPLDIPFSEDASVLTEDTRLIKAVSIESPPKYLFPRKVDLFPLYLRCSIQFPPEEEEICYFAVPTDYINGRPPFEATLVFVRTPTGVGRSQRIRALVSAVDPAAEALLAYLEQGSVSAARQISGGVVNEAVEYLRMKKENPFAACIAGYFLLKAGHTEKQDWMQNLANWFENIPDGAVIYGTSLLQGEDGRVDQHQARQYLLMAARRGIPVYTIGLRLLFDGLRLLIKSGDSDKELETALARIRYIAASTDWDAYTTTFSVRDYGANVPLQWLKQT